MWHAAPVATIRSWLYVPGDRPERIAKAVALRDDRRPDAVILDLEDAVAPSAKPAARAAVADALAGWADDAPPAWVRVNAGPELCRADVEAVAGSRPAGIVLPKATAASLGHLDELLARHEPAPLPVVALIESAQGLLDAPELARRPRVRNLALGEVDLAADLGLTRPDAATLLPLRLQVVVAAAAAGAPAPTGPVSTAVRDLDGLAASSAELRRLGFGGRSAIHPDQVPIVHAAFRPTPEEVAQATRLVAAYDDALARGDGVVVDEDGRMVDEAVVRRARALIGVSDDG